MSLNKSYRINKKCNRIQPETTSKPRYVFNLVIFGVLRVIVGRIVAKLKLKK